MGLVLWILMFMGLVLIHELGHFFAAKKSWVKVEEFGIGIPPKICKLRKDKSGTEYTLNLIPLWGFVRLKWDDPKDEKNYNSKDWFLKAKLSKKILILIAGVTANFLLAWAIFTFVFATGTKPLSMISENMFSKQINSYLMPTKSFLYQKWYISEEYKQEIENMPVLVHSVIPDSIWENMWIQEWDIIESINSEPINARNIEQTLKTNIGENFQLKYQRNWQVFQKDWSCEESDCLLWITFSYSGFSTANLSDLEWNFIKFPLFTAMGVALTEIKSQTQLTFSALGNLGKNLLSFNKKKVSWALNKMSGPVWVVKFGDILLQEGGWKQFLAFAGLISLALALFNILPIPALDWWKLLWILIQWIARIEEEKYFNIEWIISFVFFILLMGLWIYIIFKDLVQFWWVKIPFIG